MDDTELRDDLAHVLEPPPDDEAPLDGLDEDRANRMLFKVRRLARERAQVRAVASAELDRIEAWQRDRLATLDNQITDLTETLEAWMRMHHERTKTVTKKLPNGELRLRPPSARIEISDDEKANAYAVERVMTSIARNLGTEAFADRKLTSEDVWSLAFSHAMAEPFLRVKIELAKDEIKRAAQIGPVSSAHEDVELLHAVVDGEAMPGVLIERRTRKAFGMTLATAEAPSLDEGTDEAEEVDRG